MNTLQIEHIGIAVKDLNEAVRIYESLLDISCSKIEEVHDQKVRTAFFQVGQTKIELLEQYGAEGTIKNFISKKGEGIHHIAFAVKDLKGAIKEIEEKGFETIDKIPRKGADGLNIAFLHPKSTGGVLIELCEKSKG